MPRYVAPLVVSIAAALMVFTTARAEVRTVRLSVPGMTCELCPITVSKAMKRIGGVEKVTASLEKKEAVVTFDDAKTSVDALRQATANAGYPSTPVR